MSDFLTVDLGLLGPNGTVDFLTRVVFFPFLSPPLGLFCVLEDVVTPKVASAAGVGVKA